MAMSRAQMLSIINAAADDKLAAALSAIGVEAGLEDLALDQEVQPGMEPWSEVEVKVGPANKPSLLDKNKFIKQPPVVVRRPAYMPPAADEAADSDIAAYVTPDGMI